MANPNLELIQALQTTADRLRNGAFYSWGHHGACNCGNHVQSITSLSKNEILEYVRSDTGEWTEMAQEYCMQTNAPVNLLIRKLEIIGLTPVDIHNLEYLYDKEVLSALPGGFRWLKRNVREDVIVYFETFADVLEEKLLRKINIDFEPLLQHHHETADMPV